VDEGGRVAGFPAFLTAGLKPAKQPVIAAGMFSTATDLQRKACKMSRQGHSFPVLAAS